MEKHQYWLELREKEIELIWLNFIKLRHNLIHEVWKNSCNSSQALNLFEYTPHPLSVYLFHSSTMGHIKFDKILAVCTVF